MRKLLVILELLLFYSVVVYMIGCGDYEEDTGFIRANPPNNSTIGSDEVITVTFDNTPVNVSVEFSDARDRLWELDGRTLTVHGNSTFSPGRKYVIIITWTTGRKILNYAVRFSQPPPKPIEVIYTAFVNASPASGNLAANGTISVTFDNNPGDLTASAGTVAGSGKYRTISGPFTPGALALNLTWTNGDGSHALNYTIVAADETAPEVTASSPKDGAEGVDPAKVFEDGIEVTFNENVDGDLILMDGNDDVGWSSEASDNKITLTGNAGQKLSNETEYKITGTVEDGAGNEAKVSITFVTKAKD